MSDIPRVVYQLSPRSDDGLSLDPMDQMDQMGNSLPRWERRINRSGAHPMAEHKSRSDRDDMNVANSSESHHNQDNFFRRPNTNILVYDEDRGRNSNLHNTPERRSCLVKQSPARHNGIEKISLPSCRSPREMRLSKDLTQQMTKSHLQSHEKQSGKPQSPIVALSPRDSNVPDPGSVARIAAVSSSSRSGHQVVDAAAANERATNQRAFVPSVPIHDGTSKINISGTKTTQLNIPAISATALRQSKPTFESFCLHLKALHDKDNYLSAHDLLLSNTTVEQRFALAEVMKERMGSGPTFPESNESDSFNLVREIYLIFGSALHHLEHKRRVGNDANHQKLQLEHFNMSWAKESEERYPDVMYDENQPIGPEDQRPMVDSSDAHNDERKYERHAYDRQDNSNYLQTYESRTERNQQGSTHIGFDYGKIEDERGMNSEQFSDRQPPIYVEEDRSSYVQPDPYNNGIVPDMFQERQRQHAQQQKNAQQKNSLAFQNEEFPSNSEKRRPIVVGVQSNQYQHHSTYGESRSDYESGDHTDVHGGNYRELFDYEDSRKNHRMDDRSESGSTFQSSTNANNPKKNRDYDAKMTAKSFEESYDDQALMRQRLFDKIEHTSRVLRTTTDGRIRESHLHQLKTLRDEWDRLKTQAVHPFSVDCDNTSSKNGAKRLWRGEQIVLRPPGSIIGEGAEDKSIGLKSARSGKSTMSKSNIFDDDNRSCVSGPASRPMGKPTVSVVAPETLPAGFTFEARLGDRVFMATVPEGGVAKGEVFCSVIGDIDSELDRASVRVRTLLDMGGPQERWRDELFDCFSEGFFHPQICNSMFCPQVALTQIMARMQMTANGERGITLNSRFRVKQAVWLTVGVITIHLMYAIPIFIRAPQNFNLYAVSSIPLMVMDLGILIYFWFLMARTRRAMREEYDIPEIHCRWLGCEDACLAVACTTCTLSQMGRHSADYTTYRAMCCSDTGLPNHVEVKLPSDPMNEMI